MEGICSLVLLNMHVSSEASEGCDKRTFSQKRCLTETSGPTQLLLEQQGRRPEAGTAPGRIKQNRQALRKKMHPVSRRTMKRWAKVGIYIHFTHSNAPPEIINVLLLVCHFSPQFSPCPTPVPSYFPQINNQSSVLEKKL